MLKKIALWSFLLTKRQLKNIVLVVFLIGIPFSALIISRIPQMSESSIPRIGIVLLDQDPVSIGATSKLVADSEALEFYICDSIEELSSSIEEGDTECGYIFSKNLTSQLDSHSYKGCITLIKNSSGIISSLTNEMVFSSVFCIYGKNIAVNYINDSSLFDSIRTDSISMVNKKYDYYFNGAATFHINFDTLSTDSKSDELNAIQTESSSFPTRGILSILIFVAGLFGCVQWLKDSENGVFAPMSYTFVRISRILYIMIPTILFAISSMFTIYIVNVDLSFYVELKAMLLYILAITVFCLLLSYIIKNSTLLVSLMPVFIIGSLVLCPVFIDIATYFPMAKVIRELFLPYHYLIWTA